MAAPLHLDPDEVVATVGTLAERIRERFPGSGLERVCRELLAVARRARERAEAISRPIVSLRVAVAVLLGLIGAGLVVTGAGLERPRGSLDLMEFVQVLEAGINDVVLIGAAVFFLVTAETRIQRTRGLRAVHELRSIAHIIDMHQLTKDPERVLSGLPATRSSPSRILGPAELGRYLDYCSEMLSLTGKVAAVYVKDFRDPSLVAAVNEVEDLTNGLSRKIWQKLMILHAAEAGPAEGLPAPRPAARAPR